MEADKEVNIRCHCGDSQCFLNIGRWYEDDEPPILYVTISNVESSLWHRLHLAWHVLVYGRVVFNEIVIAEEAPAKKLLQYLYGVIRDWKTWNEKQRETWASTADSAATYTFSGKGKE